MDRCAATLTAAGAKAFAGFYDAGTALAPVTFSFPIGGDVECDAFSGLASTGSDAGTSPPSRSCCSWAARACSR
ncbi:HtaA domain-containing protein [Oerskovia sp. M15]